MAYQESSGFDTGGPAGFFGLYRGHVYANNDPLKKRRLRLIVPQVLDKTPTEWAWGRESAHTKTKVPSVDQGVWVMFEGGNISHPVWIGTYGKNVTKDKHLLVTPIAESQSLTGLTPYIKTETHSDGTIEVDLGATILAIAQKLQNYETRIASLETQIVQKANISHTHPGL